MQTRHLLSHARGYLELGMVAEAAAALDRIPAAEQESVEVIAVRAALLQHQEEWPALCAVAGELVRRLPAEPSGWITWAYAMRRAESLVAAERILLEAERYHPTEATIQFNLGCYACQRGDLAEARRRVDRAIALDRTFETVASTDPDLAPLRAAT